MVGRRAEVKPIVAGLQKTGEMVPTAGACSGRGVPASGHAPRASQSHAELSPPASGNTGVGLNARRMPTNISP